MTQATATNVTIIALIGDLMFASRIVGTLETAGVHVRIVSDGAELVASAQKTPPDGIIINFGAPFLDWEGAIRAIRAEPSLHTTPVLAFGPHVDTAGRAAAKAAGATRIVTNGAFMNGMPKIITALVRGSRQ